MAKDSKEGGSRGFFKQRDPAQTPASPKATWPALAGDFEEPHTRGPPPSGLGHAMVPGSDAAKHRHALKIEDVHRFLDTIERAGQDRVQSAASVEEMLDQGRTGRYTSQGVESAVEEILSKGSAPAIKAIAGLKGSDQTYAHCTDMSVILEECYSEMLTRQGRVPTEANKRFVLIAGFVHDIGKSEVPKDILDSTTRYEPDSREMTVMRNHATYGARILAEMDMNPITINVAHYHHVKRDTALFTSYPIVPYEEVLPITRLASIVDVYQALIGKRRYKRNWVSGKAVEYLRKLRGTEFDERILDSFVDSIGIYPVGTLVRLSTRELAFVLSAGPVEHPGRPMVAVVENVQGELLTHHSLLDLMLEADLQVEDVVDHYEHYTQSEDQAYQIFQSIRIDH